MPYKDPAKHKEARNKSARKRYRERPELRIYRVKMVRERRARLALEETAALRRAIHDRKLGERYGYQGKINVSRI